MNIDVDLPMKEFYDHGALLVLLAVGLWWTFSRVRATYMLFREFVGHELEERLPGLLKRELQNGLGDLVEERMRKVVDAHARDEELNLDRKMVELHDKLRRRRR